MPYERKLEVKEIKQMKCPHCKKAIPTIPISKIDEKITHLEGHGIYIEYDDVDVIKMLEDLKE